ncbi:hypothetical protein OG874_15515 [Nocardia sp. NBC_00565]|uniref:hypothetical protein n=1 Tax=Nocardia sp. NBC_00565 TaxID=2975993 RepID=UPI002E7FFAFB|nr:hypothetical protein [Nocardia sp. NBC_00565]WUC08361.1 hypothetical protein OG874_15515 [Nocardia sp. NBC_00565]
MPEFHDRSAVVTSGAPGIGAAIAHTLGKRFGEPEEVAAMVGFIVTEATFSTGSEFVIDGGATAAMTLVGPARAQGTRL